MARLRRPAEEVAAPLARPSLDRLAGESEREWCRRVAGMTTGGRSVRDRMGIIQARLALGWDINRRSEA